MNDHIIIRVLSRVFDLVLLNILWIIFSLPLITIGAATTALYSVTLKMVRNEEGYIFREYVSAFKSSFWQSTIIWILMILLGSVIGLDYFILKKVPYEIEIIGNTLLLLVWILYLIEVIFVFPFIAKFENTTFSMLKNALLIPISRLPNTFGVLAVTVLCFVITSLNQTTIMAGAVIWLFIGVALVAFVNSFLIADIFQPYIDQ